MGFALNGSIPLTVQLVRVDARASTTERDKEPTPKRQGKILRLRWLLVLVRQPNVARMYTLQIHVSILR